jgi:DNA polymerase-4/protein ImuB
MKIACVLITHLPMKAELKRHPPLWRRPVLVVRSSGSRALILDHSPEARGVMGGMPLQEALSRCKGAALLQADEPYYHSIFGRVIDQLSQRSPLVERAELGCAYVGLDGLEEMYGGEARLIASLLQAAPQHLNPRVGLAEGKFPAYVAALLSSGGQATRVCPEPAGGGTDPVARFLEPLTVDLLPISWDSKVRLHRFGLHTMGRLASLPLGSVQAQFGLEGKRSWELAGGIDLSPLRPYKHQEAVTEYLAFPTPATTLYAIALAVETLLGRAFSRGSLRGKSVRTATIESAVFRKPPWTRHVAFKEAAATRERALFALKSTLEAVSIPGPLEDMKLTLSGIAGEPGTQGSLFPDLRRHQQLRETMRQLEARLGGKPPVYRVRKVEPWSRIPERRQALVQFDP